MQTAFPLLLTLPPPAAGTLGLARRHRARAGRAADGEEAAIMQAVVGDAVIVHEIDDTLTRPIEQRVQLDEPVLRVYRREAHHRPLGRLLGAHACHPSGGASKRPSERLDLAQGTAGLAGDDRGAEAVDTVLRDPSLDAPLLGQPRLDAAPIALLGLRPDLVRFREQAASIEGHDVDRQILRQDGVTDRLVLEAKACREDDAAANDAACRSEALGKVKWRKRVREALGFVGQGLRMHTRSIAHGAATMKLAVNRIIFRAKP